MNFRNSQIDFLKSKFIDAGIPHTYENGFGELEPKLTHAFEVMNEKQYKRFYALAYAKDKMEILRSIEELQTYRKE